MTEPESYSQWSAKNALDKDPIDALRDYTGYLRTEYLNRGELNEQVEQDIQSGIEEKLRTTGTLRDDNTEEELADLNTRLFAPKQNTLLDADLISSYLALDDPDANEPSTKENAALLRKYASSLKFNPAGAAELEGAASELLQDSDLVRRARESAVDRGDLQAVGINNKDGGRDVYTGSNTFSDEDLPLVASSLATNGALDTSDFLRLKNKMRRVHGGKATANEEQRLQEFNNALEVLSKTDLNVKNILGLASNVEAKKSAAEQETLAQRGGMLAWASLIENPLGLIAEGLGNIKSAVTGQDFESDFGPTDDEVLSEQLRKGDVTAEQLIAERLSDNEALRKRFSPEEIARYTRDIVTANTNFAFDAEKPETGIRELSTGAVVVAPALLAKPQLFEASLGKAALNEDQKTAARLQREASLDERAPQMLKLLTELDDDAASAFATAKQQGKTDRAFLEEWMSNEDNYSAFNNRLSSTGLSAWSGAKDFALGLAASATGSETISKFAVESAANTAAQREKRKELASMFGDDYGLGQQIFEALPQVAMDLALGFATAGVGAVAAKGVARAAIATAGRPALMTTARAFAKQGIMSLDDVSFAAFRKATTAGGGVSTSDAIRAIGANWIKRASGDLATKILPVALPAFSRSTSNSYVSIYGGLPEGMSHEAKHKQALAGAVATGFATAAITVGMGRIGFGGPESLAVLGSKKTISDLTFREAKKVFEVVNNQGKAVSNAAFQKALAAEVGGAYKNLAAGVGKGVLGEAFEEALDQSINIAIEDASLKRETPLAEKLQQVWNAALVGGAIGGGFALGEQLAPVSKSAATRALESRVSVLDGIAKRLSTSNAPETAASVQRMMDAANAAAVANTKKDTVAAAAQAAKAPTTAVRTVAEQLEFKFDDPRGVPPADTRLADLVGERVYIGDTGINGIAEIDADTGEVVINFSKPTKVKDKPNVTRYVLGTKFQKATGVTLKPKIKTLAKPVGTLPVGTRIFNTNKLDYVLPTPEAVSKARAAGKPLVVLQRDENQRVVGITVRGVALVKSPTTTTDTTITDPDLMREVLRLYPEPAPTTPTGGFTLESGEQLELDFNTPRPAPTTPTGGFALVPADQLELDFSAPPEPELQVMLDDPNQLELDFEAEAPESTKTNFNALAVILAGDPVLNFLRATDPKRKGFAASVQQIPDGEWSEAGAALEEAYDFVAELGDSEPLLTKAALDTLGPILFKYDTGTTIRKRNAAKSARRNQGAPAPSPAPEAEAPPVAPTPEPAPPAAPAPTPAAKKAAKKAAKAEPTKEQVLNEVAQALVKLEQALVKERKLGSRQLGDRKIAREISEKLTGLGFAPADTPEGFFLNVVDAGDPSAFERLVGAFQWASGQPEPVAEAAPEPAATGDITEDDVLNWLAEEGNAESLVGKQVRLSSKMGGDVVTISSVEGQTLFYRDPDPRMGEVEGDVEAGDFDPESFTPYLEAVPAEPEAGAVEPEPTAESEFDRARNAAAKMQDLLKAELNTDYPRLSELALAPKAKRAKVLAKIREILLGARVSPFSQGFFLYGTEEVERTLSVTKQLYDEAVPDEDIKKQKAEVLKRIREKVEQAIVEARTDEQTARARKIVEKDIGKKVTSYGSLTPANLVLFGPSGYGFVNLDKEAQELRGLDPNRSKKYFADRLAKAEDFNSEWRTLTLDVGKEVDELNKQAPTPEPSTPPVDPKFRKALSAYVESVDDAKTNLASPARAKALAKKGLDAGFIDQQTHDEAVREANDKGMDPDDRAQSAFDTLLGEAQDRLDTLDRQAGTLSMLAPQGAAVARHTELEAKFNAGTITPEETAEAQRIVEAAARAAGYTRRGYHGTPRGGFTEFKPGSFGPLFFFAKERSYADYYANRFVGAPNPQTYSVFLRAENPKGMESVGQQEDKLLAYRTRKEGFDSIETPNALVVFLPDQIKSADPFTGVQLDQRFDLQSPNLLQTLALPDSPTLRQNIADIPAALRGMLPAGFTLVADPNMDGALGYNAVTDPTVVRYNPNLVGSLTAGLARADAMATLRTAVDHELGHAAAEEAFGQDGYESLAVELGEDKLLDVAGNYYSLLEPDFNRRTERIKKDRASGALPDWKIAAEWVRMEIERIANGRTSEQRMLFLRSRPSLLAKFIDALGAFVTRLRARFFENPTTGTAASISNAARQLRKLRNGGWLPAPPKADLNYGGHAAELIGAIERGSDQTLFTMPIGAATAAGKAQVEGLWTRIGKKFQNLPPYLRDNKEERDGIMALGNNIILNFNKRFSKLTKENPAIPIDDIRTVLGRTDPTLDNAALAQIQTELDAFSGALPFDMDTVLAEEMIDKERDRLQQRERLASNNAFRQEQQSAEQRIRNAGAPALADLLVKFRTDINNMSARFTDLSPVIDENMGVYLTRTYRFHNTEGWALLAKGGIQPDGSQLGMFRGKEIDFAKLRDNAARTYEQDALAKAAKDGVVLTAEQLRDRTHEMLDKYLAKLQGSAESSPSPSQDSLQKDLTKLMPKGNINKELMELLGVIEDPLENAVRTMVAVTKIAANNTFLRSTYDTLLSMNLASTKQTPEMGVKALRVDKDGSLSPLSDLFTTPEIANALQAEWGVNARNAERNTDSVMREGGRALMAVASFATTTKTLFSFGFYPRNAVSGQGLLLSAQGILPINGYMKEAYGLARRAYFESNERTPEQDATIQRLIELQVLADDTQGRVAMDIMRGFVTDNEQDLDALLRDFQEATEGKPKKLLDRIGSSAAGKTYGKTVDVLASLNNWFDGAVKTQAYMYELDVLKKDNAAALAKDPLLLAQLELRAADKVKMTMPSHSRQLPIVKSLNQTSVGMVFFPFARWKTEVFRTMYNTPRLALKEIREGGPAEKARGYRRMFGFTSTLTFGGSAVGAVYAGVFRFIGGLLGEDEEKKDTRELTNDEIYALRESLPVWQRGHALHTRLVGGQVQVIDMTAITPYAQLTDLFVITHEGIVNKEADWNAKRTAGYVAQQLIGTQIAATALNEVLNNSDDFGQPVYRDTDNPVEVTGKILAHFGGSALKPAALDQVMRATRGGEQDRWEIITGELIGARPRNHKMSEIEYRAFRGVKKMLDDSAQIKASLVTGRKIDEDEVVQTLEDHQESLNRTQRKLAKVMQGLQSMGSTRGGLFGSGKNAGFSAQRLALAEKGDNLRWVPNQDWLKGVYQNMTRTGEDDPMNRIRLIRRTLSGMPATYGVSE